MQRVILLLGILGLLSACESLKREVDLSLITTEPEKLIVTCFISPEDSIVTATVSRSRPVLGEATNGDPTILNATVTIARSGQPTVPFHLSQNTSSGLRYYETKVNAIRIVAGETYTLTVQVPDGRKVTARCTVPTAIKPNEAIIDSTTSFENGTVFKDFYVQLNWQDPVNTADYYRVAGTLVFIPVSSRVTFNVPPYGETSAINFSRNSNNRSLVNDSQNNGGLLSSPRGFFLPSRTSSQITLWQILISQYKFALLWLDLLHTDENYYRYHEAINRQNQTDGNPFAEPVLIPTNVEGGLGCFGAYNRTHTAKLLK